MKKPLHTHIIDESFLKDPKRYITQSLIAVVAVATILYFVEVVTHSAIVAALGSSAFIVFAIPWSTTAQTRNLVGGHIVGLLCGAFCYFVLLNGPLSGIVIRWHLLTLLVYALTVGAAIFVMVITNTEHPPAAGTALGIVLQPWSWQVVIFIVAFALGLALVRWLLRHRLTNLI